MTSEQVTLKFEKWPADVLATGSVLQLAICSAVGTPGSLATTPETRRTKGTTNKVCLIIPVDDLVHRRCPALGPAVSTVSLVSRLQLWPHLGELGNRQKWQLLAAYCPARRAANTAAVGATTTTITNASGITGQF